MLCVVQSSCKYVKVLRICICIFHGMRNVNAPIQTLLCAMYCAVFCNTCALALSWEHVGHYVFVSSQYHQRHHLSGLFPNCVSQIFLIAQICKVSTTIVSYAIDIHTHIKFYIEIGKTQQETFYLQMLNICVYLFPVHLYWSHGPYDTLM